MGAKGVEFLPRTLTRGNKGTAYFWKSEGGLYKHLAPIKGGKEREAIRGKS